MFDERESSEFELTPDLAAIERQLARMTPAAPRIDRDRLMFEAGKAASQPERPAYIGEPSRLAARFWPAATAMMTAASVLLATMLVWQRQSTQVVMQPVMTAQPTPPVDTPPGQPQLASPEPARASLLHTTWPAKPSTGYLGVRNVSLARGLNAADVLSSAANIGGGKPARDLEPTQRKMLNELLPSS